jgi:hypothetical protein
MKAIWTAVVISVCPVITIPVFAQGAPSSLPRVEKVLQGVLARAERESTNDREFNQRYRYTRTRVTETRDGHGELKKREAKRNLKNPAAVSGADQRSPPANPPPPATAAKNSTLPQTNSTVRGKASGKTDVFLDDELLKRFEFTITGREQIHGRAAWVVDFQPAKGQPAAMNAKEWFIKKTAGRIWVDEADYTLARVNLRLTETINLVGGLIGNITKFAFSFDRARTADGVWFTRLVHWHLEGRELLVQRAIDYQEEITDVQEVR